MMFPRTFIAVPLVAALAAAPVLAQDAGAAAVKARQSHMQLYAFNLATLGGMARGTTAYEARAATDAAANLAALSRMAQTGYWLPDTAAGAVEGSRALPAIWEAGSEIGARAGALVAAATAMEAAAGDGLDAVKAAMGPLGGACGACHKSYRQASN